jgi:hypothetical protein
MKLSLLVGAAVGYVLGAKAGRGRYEQIVRTARRLAGSQTVQATAGVLQAQVDAVTQRARGAVASRLSGAGSHAASSATMANGFRH